MGNHGTACSDFIYPNEISFHCIAAVIAFELWGIVADQQCHANFWFCLVHTALRLLSLASFNWQNLQLLFLVTVPVINYTFFNALYRAFSITISWHSSICVILCCFALVCVARIACQVVELHSVGRQYCVL
jgi:hypothetical protein